VFQVDFGIDDLVFQVDFGIDDLVFQVDFGIDDLVFQVDFGFDEEVGQLGVGRDFGLMVTTTGKLYYTGKSSAIGHKQPCLQGNKFKNSYKIYYPEVCS
jgi:hypothetical protein